MTVGADRDGMRWSETVDVEAARADLRALMDRLAQRADLDDESAMTLAVEEVRGSRTARRSAATLEMRHLP